MRNSGIQVRLSDLLFALQKRWKIILALTFVGLTFGLILSAMTFVQSSFQSYEISGSYSITTKLPNGYYSSGYLVATASDFHLSEDMVDAVYYVIMSDRVAYAVITDQNLLGITPTQLRSYLTVKQYNATQIFDMRLIWRSAEEGIDIWNSIVENVSAVLPVTLQIGELAVVNEPEAVLVGVGGSGGSLPVFLTMLGMAAGIGYAVIELLLHPTLNNVRDVETLFGLETLGIVPWDTDHFKKNRSMLVNSDGDSSEFIQSYSAAAYILRNRLGSKEGHQCFFVTSATTHEGKSSAAANLAIQLSDMEQHTLLIDFDTRNPNLGALFLNKVEYDRSLNALYRGDATVEEAITTLTGYLDLLPTVLEHNAISMDSTIIELIQKLAQKYDYVILDAPPVGTVSDTLSLNQVANSALFVIGYDKSTIPEISSSLEKLDKSGIRVLGCIVNGVKTGKNASSDERIKKVVRKKKKKEESFAPSTEEKNSASPVEELLVKSKDAGQPAAGKAKKKHLFKGKEAEKQEAEPPAPPPARSAGQPAGNRNVMEDLMNEETADKGASTQETMEELLRLGLKTEPDEPKDADPPPADGGTQK